MLAIARNPDALVTQTEIAQQLGTTIDVVQKPVSSLLKCGLLKPAPLTGTRQRYFVRIASPAWAWAEEMETCVDRGEVSSRSTH
jgi:DNA-binding MarR family transcriptional regulator